MSEEKIKAKDMLNRLLDKHYEEAWEAKQAGKKVGWVSSNFPQEFLEAMGLTVCYPENHSTSLSAKHESMDMIAIAKHIVIVVNVDAELRCRKIDGAVCR